VALAAVVVTEPGEPDVPPVSPRLRVTGGAERGRDVDRRALDAEAAGQHGDAKTGARGRASRDRDITSMEREIGTVVIFLFSFT